MASLFAGGLSAKPDADEVKFCAFADIHYYPGVFPHDTREWLERVLNRAENSKVERIRGFLMAAWGGSMMPQNEAKHLKAMDIAGAVREDFVKS